jgi:hypothetical protein
VSRSYRISVRESENRIIRAEDCVSTHLEILEVLPPDQMADLLAAELEAHGFECDGEKMVRTEESGVKVSVDPTTGTVSVSAESSEEIALESERDGRAYDDVGGHAKQVREHLSQEAKKDIDRKASDKTKQMQSKVTDKLEAELSELSAELDQVVNQVTAKALKQKAAQLGQIKQITEDPQSGSLTIVVEV